MQLDASSTYMIMFQEWANSELQFSCNYHVTCKRLRTSWYQAVGVCVTTTAFISHVLIQAAQGRLDSYTWWITTIMMQDFELQHFLSVGVWQTYR